MTPEQLPAADYRRARACDVRESRLAPRRLIGQCITDRSEKTKWPQIALRPTGMKYLSVLRSPAPVRTTF